MTCAMGVKGDRKMKLKLEFVNKGKPFEVSEWTVEKHEKALELCVKECKELPKTKQDQEFRYYVIYIGLREIDSDVPFEKVHKLHVENVIELFNIIYNAGKVDIFFRKKKSIKTKN